MLRTKYNAAYNEDEDIKTIIKCINERNACGMKIIDSFRERFNFDILEARERIGNSRKKHYDFSILVRYQNSTEWMQVEHKGSKHFRPINVNDKPWAAGVQFHNGGCEKYSIAKKYARLWYDIHIKSGNLQDKFNAKAPIPTFEDWFDKDCKAQSDPKTVFGKELKKRVRDERGPRSSILEARQPILEAFELSEEEKQEFITEVLPIANHALNEKHYWLTIHGNIQDGTDNFYVAWYPKFIIEQINKIDIIKNLDIEFKIECNNDFTFKAILRWGKGAGFSCLRIDLK